MVGNDRVVTGFYSYPGPDGVPYTVTYIADKNGYRASGSHIPGGSVPSSGVPSSGINIPVIPVQPLQPTIGYTPTTPAPIIISSTPYTPTQSPFSPTQTIYTPTSTFIPSSTPYTPGGYVPSSIPYTPAGYVPSSTPYTPSGYVPSSTLVPTSTPFPPTSIGYSPQYVSNDRFPVYTQSTVPFPGYVYSQQPVSAYSGYSGPTGQGGVSTPVTRFNFATRSTSTYAPPTSTPAPLIRNYQSSYGLADNRNSPVIVTTPRPYGQDTVYITPSPSKVYINQPGLPSGFQSNLPSGSVLVNRELLPPYVAGSAIDASSYYRNNNNNNNNYGLQSVRPLATSGPSGPSGPQSITNLSFRNGNAY